LQTLNISGASPFQQMQAMVGGAFTETGFGAGLTGQNLPTTEGRPR